MAVSGMKMEEQDEEENEAECASQWKKDFVQYITEEEEYDTYPCSPSYIQKLDMEREVVVRTYKLPLCEDCGEAFTNSEDFKRHLTRHGSRHAEESPTPPGGGDDRNILNKHHSPTTSIVSADVFTQREQLQSHQADEVADIPGPVEYMELIVKVEPPSPGDLQTQAINCDNNYNDSVGDGNSKEMIPCDTSTVVQDFRGHLTGHGSRHAEESPTPPGDGDDRNIFNKHHSFTTSIVSDCKADVFTQREQLQSHQADDEAVFAGPVKYIELIVKEEPPSPGDLQTQAINLDNNYNNYVGDGNSKEMPPRVPDTVEQGDVLDSADQDRAMAEESTTSAAPSSQIHSVAESGRPRPVGKVPSMCNPSDTPLKYNSRSHGDTSSTHSEKCSVCGGCFVNLAKHMRLHVHEGRKIHQCKHCSEYFQTKWDLKKHARIVHPGKVHRGQSIYKCDMCHKAFAKKWDLNKHKKLHLQKIHASRNVVKCDCCSRCYPRNWNLEAHRKIPVLKEGYGHTPKKDDLQCHVPMQFSKLCVCHICRKSCGTLDRLRKHMNTHIEEGQAKSHNLEVFKDLAQGTGEQQQIPPFQSIEECGVCGKMISLQRLNDHMTQHKRTSYPRYTCKLCKTVWSNRYGYIRHMRAHKVTATLSPPKATQTRAVVSQPGGVPSHTRASHHECRKRQEMKRVHKKKRWTRAERLVVAERLKTSFLRWKVPGKADCEKCIAQEPVLQGRKWTLLKDFMRNQILKSDPFVFL